MPDLIKAVWQKFINQSGGVHLLVAAALLVMTVSLLEPAGPTPEPNLQEHSVNEPVATEIIIQDPGPADPAEIPLTSPATESASVVSVVPDTETSAVLPDSESNPEAPEQPAAQLVLIIDDIGYNAEAGRRAINLPGEVTFAVIPYTPHGKTLAESAHQANKEVMLHAPMSNLSGMDLGQGGLTLQLDEEEFLQTLKLALADIPHIKGVNNHTGSELTAAVQPMQWLMQELKSRELYFVDSVTTNISVAAATAEQYQVPSLRRHVFLDNVQTAEAIDFEFRRALTLAEKQGFAVAIGHPYPETLAYLESALPLLAERNIQLVFASSMIAQLQKPEPMETTAAW